MRCATARRMLSDRIDDRLAGARAEALARHLDACAACAEEGRRLERLDGLLAEWRAPVTPAALRQRILNAPRVRRLRETECRPVFRWAAAAALVAAALAFVLAAGNDPPAQVARPAPPAPAPYVYVSPDLPPDVAAALTKASPELGEAAMAWGRRIGPSLAHASERLTDATRAAPVALRRAADELLDELRQMGDALRRIGSGEQRPHKPEGRLDGALPRRLGELARGSCVDDAGAGDGGAKGQREQGAFREARRVRTPVRPRVGIRVSY